MSTDASRIRDPESLASSRFTAVAEHSWKMLIGGELRDARSGQSMPAIHPGDGSAVCAFPSAESTDVDAAVAEAKSASAHWAARAIAERAECLLALADEVVRCGEELAWIDTIDNGSPMAVMRNDYTMAADQLRYFAGLALQVRGETIPVAARDAIDFTLHQPFGVVGRLVPFNHPLMFAASRIGAPLLAGNTVVLKPSEQTSLSALRLGELAAGIFPPGVLNIVTGTGPGAGDPLVVHPDVPRIAFTGSEAVGRHILRRAAEVRVKTVTLELGGKNPMIVFPDADFEAAVEGAVRGMNFRWQGQSCGSTSRLFVHRTLYDRFLRALEGSMTSLQVGDPTLESTDVGPVVSQQHYRRVRSFIELGLDDPALELITGGHEIDGPGYFIPPTLFSAARGASGPLFTDEIFGPVLVAAPFDDYGEAITIANSLPLGLTASIWTSNLHTALAAARDIQTGYLWVNWASEHIPGTSFGGIKNSGIGREESLEEIESYTQRKNIYLRF